jgi:hypothetical protein
MTESSNKTNLIESDLKATFRLLSRAFPNLDQVPLHDHILDSPHLAQLAARLSLNIPVDAYPPNLIALHQQIT